MSKNKDFRRHQHHSGAHSDKEPDRKPIEPETDPEVEDVEEVEPEEVAEAETAESEAVEESDEIETLKAELEKEKKEYLFLMAEFDNFRKRTLKEKAELMRNAGEGVLKGLLPIVDDFERGLKATEGSDNAAGVREGMELIYNKLCKFLAQNGVKPMESTGQDFDSERHEAISVVPAPEENLKGKVLDTVEKGYDINDKVLRHAKVVVAQ